MSNSDESDSEVIGPMPTAANPDEPPAKKIKVIPHEKIYLDNLPNSECYERSYMHRDVITHLLVTPTTDFLITASIDGHVKFWKKREEGIEFVKHFRSHLLPINSLSVNANGTYICTASMDKTVKVFDVINFDMINMIKLDFIPNCTEWITSPGDAIIAIAVADKESSNIHILDAKAEAGAQTIHTFEKLHRTPAVAIRYNVAFDVVISVDQSGILEYWQGPQQEYKFPSRIVSFESKLDTSLFEFAKNKTVVTGIAFSRDGRRFATISTDRKVRIFQFLTGKLIKMIDETLPRFAELQQKVQTLPNMEFGRRMATEKELEKSEMFRNGNIVFDYSGHFIMYATMLGVKVVNIDTNKCVNMIGKSDNLRPVHLALYQGKPKRTNAATTIEQEASENPALQNTQSDPTIFCTAFKKQRFYLYSKRLPSDLQDNDRDVFNERPSKEDIISVSTNQGDESQKVFDNAVIHTSKGDIHLKLFSKECPKTIENFCVHAKNGYYNGNIFHRVIKGFMIQSGDPTGTGCGGESIWGGEFCDEFVPSLRHDRPYTLSMANGGPNSNGSQFFITVLPTPWLDNKHTVFGRAVKGMEVIQNICNSKTNPKTDKPYDEIKIISIQLS